MNPLNDMYALRHEDCSCEECLLKLEEEYEKLADEHKRPRLDEDDNPNEDNFYLTKIQRAFRDGRE